MRLQDLKAAPGAVKRRKRVGRGCGSGHGKTSCRGQDGQNSRSGGGVRPGFEGGQMPLQRRIPKRGFNNSVFRTEYAVVNVKDLNIFDNGTEVTPELLKERGLVNDMMDGVKLLGDGELEKTLVVKVHKASRQAEEKVQAKNGRVEVL